VIRWPSEQPGRMCRALIIAAMLTCIHAASSLVCAAEANLLSERDFLAEIPRVFSASRLPQAPADTPGAVTVIDREMVLASGAREFAELFRLVPGFVVGYANAGRPVVAYHGLSGQFSQRMQVLLDGRSLYAPYLFGGIDWNTLPVNLDDIERIEILRGSNSASYGANAFLGMVNIITRAAAQSRGNYASVSAGNTALSDVSARLGAGTSALSWRVSAGSRRDNGLRGAFDNRRLDYASLRSEWQLSGTDELQVSAGINQNRTGLGNSRSAADPERFENTRSAYGLIRWQRTISADHEISFSGSHTLDRGDDRYAIPVTADDALQIDYGRKASRGHLEYQHYLALGPTLRASWGAEWRRDALVAPQLFNTAAEQRTDAARAYLNAEWRVAPRWTINLGALVERDSQSGTHFAPRLVANWKIDDNQAIRLGYSEAFRTPSLFEQRSDWRFVYAGQTIDIRYLSRGGLRPEQVRVAEVSYLGEIRRLGLSFDARIFHERISDLITQQRYALPPGQEFDPNSGAFDLRNAGSARITGLEYQLRWRPGPSATWVLGHYMAKRASSDAYITESVPGWSVHLMGIFRLGNERTASFFYGATAPIRWIGESSVVPRQQRFDVRLDQHFRAGETRAMISLIGQNLLGDLTEFRAGQSQPRRGWIALTVEY
jgi:iron complex outermembrane receptor protein